MLEPLSVNSNQFFYFFKLKVTVNLSYTRFASFILIGIPNTNTQLTLREVSRVEPSEGCSMNWLRISWIPKKDGARELANEWNVEPRSLYALMGWTDSDKERQYITFRSFRRVFFPSPPAPGGPARGADRSLHEVLRLGDACCQQPLSLCLSRKFSKKSGGRKTRRRKMYTEGYMRPAAERIRNEKRTVLEALPAFAASRVGCMNCNVRP